MIVLLPPVAPLPIGSEVALPGTPHRRPGRPYITLSPSRGVVRDPSHPARYLPSVADPGAHPRHPPSGCPPGPLGRGRSKGVSWRDGGPERQRSRRGAGSPVQERPGAVEAGIPGVGGEMDPPPGPWRSPGGGAPPPISPPHFNVRGGSADQNLILLGWDAPSTIPSTWVGSSLRVQRGHGGAGRTPDRWGSLPTRGGSVSSYCSVERTPGRRVPGGRRVSLLATPHLRVGGGAPQGLRRTPGALSRMR